MTDLAAPPRTPGIAHRLALGALCDAVPVRGLLPDAAVRDADHQPEIAGGNPHRVTVVALPREVTLSALATAWSGACTGIQCEGLRPYFWNSVLMAVPAVALSTLIGAMNGYVIAQWRFRGANLIFSLMLFGCFIPFQVVLLPMARTLGFLNLAGTIPGLIFVHVIYGIGFTTLFFRNYYVTIPRNW
jgi:ABC-type glycerol-3-phosphate transport system permease component